MSPYWHVPRIAASAYVEANVDGTFTLVCADCGKTIKALDDAPTVEQIVKASKKHKH